MMSIRRKKAEMSEPQYEGGGWNNAMLSSMSPATRARILQADAEYEQEAARIERERAQRREELRGQAFRASVRAAVDRGEIVDMRRAMRDGGVGRTPAEVIEFASAQMDVEDERRAAEVRKAFNEFQSQYYLDTTAPSPAQKLEAEAGAARAAKNAETRRTRKAEARRKRKESDELDRRIVRFSRSVARLHDDGVL